MDETEHSKHGLIMEKQFHSFLWHSVVFPGVPNTRLFRVPPSGKGRNDHSFDVILEFDYVYYFDVVGTYADENGFRLFN